MIDARTIAMLARAPTTSLDDAVTLIERFAAVEASGAAAQSTRESYDSMLELLKKPVPIRSFRFRYMPPGQCAYCDAHREDSMMPPHAPSDRCESGKHNHCSCDLCF